MQRLRWLWVSLGVGLLALLVANLAMGAFSISPTRVVAVLADHAGVDLGVDFTTSDDAVVWSIRLPRVLLAAVIGAGLGVAGMTLQAAFRNPLGETQILGISGGAATGAVIAVASIGAASGAAAPMGGVIGAALALWLLVVVARYRGRTEVATLVLAGVALAAVTAAVVGLVAVVVDNDELRSAPFWLLGALSGATWRELAITSGIVGVGVAVLPFLAARLDLLLLGEREAAHLGVDVKQVRLLALGATSLLTGAAVAAAGIVGFVGLVAPHAVRAVLGPAHRRLVLASAAAGAIFVMAADLVARTVATPTEAPLGVITAIVGGPLFLWLLRRTRAEYGEWG
ncbi:MAG: iron ABC transporter permease [Acidimicrobiia bacterium]